MMNSIEKLLRSLAGMVEGSEENVRALLEMVRFVRARELPELLPHVVEAAYGNPICFVVTVRNVPKAAVFGADKVIFENYIMSGELEEGPEMAGQVRQIRGPEFVLDAGEEEERLEAIAGSGFFEVIDLADAVRDSALIVKELSGDGSRCFLVTSGGKPRAGLFPFDQDDLENFISGWHPEWVARNAAWREEIEANERGERRTLFSVGQWLVRFNCESIVVGDEEERSKSLESFRQMEGAAELLIEALGDEVASVRAGAALALGQLGVVDAVPGLAAAAVASEEDVFEEVRPRLACFRALIDLGEASVNPLMEMLDNPDDDIRGLAVWALGKIGEKRAARPLIDLLGDEAGWVRRDAAIALGRIRDQAAVDPLIESLNDEDPRVRWASAISLKKLGDRKALEPLRLLLDDEDEEVREGAREAIDGLGAARHDEPRPL